MIQKRTSERTGRVSFKARLWVTLGDREVERSKTFATRRDALAWERDQHAQRATGDWCDPRAAQITLSQWHAETWDTLSARWRASTRSTYELSYRLRVAPQFGEYRLSQITPGAIEAAGAVWMRDASRATVQNALSVLSAHLDLAARSGRIRTNPVLGARRPTGSNSAPTRRHRPLTEPEVGELAYAATSVGGHELYGHVVRLLAFTGLRWSEMVALEIGDLDLDRHRLHVRRAEVSVRGRLELGATKNATSRTVPISDAVYPSLIHLAGGRSTDSRLVLGVKGAALRVTTFRAATQWPTTVAALGFRSFRIHDLRSTAIAWMLDRGVALHVVRSAVGHHSVGVTDTYARTSDQAIDQATVQLNRLLPA